MELDFAARALLGGVNDASVEGTGVNVQTYRALIEFAGVKDAVDRFEGIDGAGVQCIHLNDFRGLDCAFTESDVLLHDMKVFH